ncbi:MAG: DUF4832 domain-containing protein [Planctomycetota bacterium]|nr:DUF4832 domain-containing protein [Planctomycetota bacterium]
MRQILCGLILGSAVLSAAAQCQEVIVTPDESDEILANPGMGWETFHCTSKRDKSLPPWIPSTVHYARWGWGELEPAPGKIDYAFLDKVLKETHDSGQALAFRVMCCSTSLNQPYHPKWLKEAGGRELQADYEGHGPFPIPDMDDPIVLKAHLDFVARLGEKYDGHPDIAHVDLGSVGWWGEWHLSGSKNCKMTADENCLKVVNTYLSAFKKTPLLMLIGGGRSLKYATGHGTGWRADCLGDMGGFSKTWSHMLKGYPFWVKEAGIQEAWRTAPVAWESGWDMRKWVQEGWPLRYIFNYALACHASVLNNKSAPLPQGDNVRPELERFLRRLGYRLVLKELKHPAEVKAGEPLAITMKWQNTGSAPCYRPYRLAYRLAIALPDGKEHVEIIQSDTTVNRFLPGTMELFTPEFLKEPKDLPAGEVQTVTDALKLSQDSPPGAYSLAVGVVDARTGLPVVRLGIKGRAESGWYPLSNVQVSRKP